VGLPAIATTRAFGGTRYRMVLTLRAEIPPRFLGPHDSDYNPRLHDRFNCEDSEEEDSEGEE
jgi:hypothetical protein